MSTRKARKQTISAGRQRSSRASRYLGEWAGPWRWARTLRTKRTRVMRAAMGWTMSRFVSEFWALLGSAKSDLPSFGTILSEGGTGTVCQSSTRSPPARRHTNFIPERHLAARGGIAPPKHAKPDAAKACNVDLRNDGRAQHTQQEQDECYEQHRTQRRCRAEWHLAELGSTSRPKGNCEVPEDLPRRRRRLCRSLVAVVARPVLRRLGGTDAERQGRRENSDLYFGGLKRRSSKRSCGHGIFKTERWWRGGGGEERRAGERRGGRGGGGRGEWLGTGGRRHGDDCDGDDDNDDDDAAGAARIRTSGT